MDEVLDNNMMLTGLLQLFGDEDDETIEVDPARTTLLFD